MARVDRLGRLRVLGTLDDLIERSQEPLRAGTKGLKPEGPSSNLHEEKKRGHI